MAGTPGRQLVQRVGKVLVVATGALILALLLGRIGVVQDLMRDYELKTLDYRMARYRGSLFTSGTSPSGLIIVDIDEKSLEELGQFQRWPRYYHAQLLDSLAGARAVGFDILFSEADNFPPEVVAHYARELSAGSEAEEGRARGFLQAVGGDEAFAEAVSAAGNVILGIGARLDGDSLLFNPPASGLARGAAGVGHVQLLPDHDGVQRRVPGAIRQGDSLVLALAVRLFLQERGLPAAGVTLLPEGGLEGSGWFIPTDSRGDILLDYSGPSGTFLSLSYVDVLKGRVARELFEDRTILVGASASGLMDLVSTPFGPGMPGVEVHANLVQQLEDGRWVRKADLRADLVGSWLLALLAAGSVFLLGPLGAASIACAGFAGYTLFAMERLVGSGIWTSLTLPWFVWVLSLLMAAGVRYWTEARSRQAIKSAFSLYLAPEVVEAIARDPSRLELGGEERIVTVGFSDIRGFTTAAEGLSPRDLTTFLNEFLSEVTGLVLREEGMVDKYIGDAVMMLFGAPNEMEDHRARACRAALAIRDAVRLGEDRWARLGIPGLRIGVGLNTGQAVVGNLGSSFRFEYTALGDTVNLASRLESLNKTLGTEILVGNETRQGSGSAFVFREMGWIRLKGKRNAVAVHELLGLVGQDEAATASLRDRGGCFERSLEAYRSRDWARAWAGFEECLALHPEDGPARYYLKKTDYLRVSPPEEDWDATLEMEEGK